MKKTLCLLLSASLLLGLCACGAKTPEAAQTAESSAEPIKLI